MVPLVYVAQSLFSNPLFDRELSRTSSKYLILFWVWPKDNSEPRDFAELIPHKRCLVIAESKVNTINLYNEIIKSVEDNAFGPTLKGTIRLQTVWIAISFISGR